MTIIEDGLVKTCQDKCSFVTGRMKAVRGVLGVLCNGLWTKKTHRC
jgi:hypothetical protein